MRLGFAVKVLGDGGLPSHDMRRWQSGPHLRESLGHLERILGYCDRNGIRMYRMATALAPYASHPDLPQLRDQPRACAAELARVGERARALGIRLSTHPGQYTVLNSEDERTRRLAVDELEVQAELLDGDREALDLALATWPDGVTPKLHYSSPKTAVEERRRRVGRRVERSLLLAQLRAHADVIDPIAFGRFLDDAAGARDFDVMLEAKAKDLALLRLREQLAERRAG